MTVEAQAAGRFTQIRGKPRTMHVVACEARHAMSIHLAGDKIISLHPVLVGRAVGKVSESGIAQLVFFQTLPYTKATSSRVNLRRGLGCEKSARTASGNSLGSRTTWAIGVPSQRA